MPKTYSVTLVDRSATVTAQLDVEANSQDEAEEIALGYDPEDILWDIEGDKSEISVEDCYEV